MKFYKIYSKFYTVSSYEDCWFKDRKPYKTNDSELVPPYSSSEDCNNIKQLEKLLDVMFKAGYNEVIVLEWIWILGKRWCKEWTYYLQEDK